MPEEKIIDPLIPPTDTQTTPTDVASLPKPLSVMDNDLLVIKKARAGIPTYTPTRFIEQFYLQDNGVFWININNVWVAQHWQFISSATGNNVTVPAGTNFILVESSTSLNSSNVGGQGMVTLSRDKTSATFSVLDHTAGNIESFTATWDLNDMTVTTALNGTFHFYT